MNLHLALERFKAMDREMVLISHINSVLGWDQEIAPPAAAAGRASQSGYLETLYHRILTSDELGTLLETLQFSPQDNSAHADLSERDQALVRVVGTARQREQKLNEEFVKEFAETTSHAHSIWVEARERDDFDHFKPILERIVALVRQKAELYGYTDEPYDPLLERFESDTTTAEVATLFGAMATDLQEIREALAESETVDDSFLYQKYPREKQERFIRQVLDAMGFDWQRGIMGTAAHPFTTTLGADDIRITTRYSEPSVTSPLFSAIHEGGHALYEQRSSHALTRNSSLAGGTSLAMHESQSRLWENMIGRSQLFWEHFFPSFKRLFPTQLDGVDVNRFVKAINRVKPSAIRVDADEVTYGLHIILRFNLERQLVSGTLAVKDLIDAWNAEMERLLGIQPKSTREGVLQDIHWSMGELGYFPTYALGNLYGAQIYETMAKEIEVEKALSSGQLTLIADYLEDKIYRYGSIYKPKELLKRVTGKSLESKHFSAYLRAKHLGGLS